MHYCLWNHVCRHVNCTWYCGTSYVQSCTSVRRSASLSPFTSPDICQTDERDWIFFEIQLHSLLFRRSPASSVSEADLTSEPSTNSSKKRQARDRFFGDFDLMEHESKKFDLESKRFDAELELKQAEQE
jgi:hypothetical protein